MSTDLSINPTEISQKIVEFIKSTVHNAGYSKVILGLSGGIDSAVSCALAVAALGVENVHAGIYPYGDLNKEAEKDAKFILNHLAIQPFNHHRIDIKPLVDPIISLDKNMDKTRKGNIMARIRMILLYDLSKKIPALVLGTENKTEHLLGYFTRFGDEASDIEPIRNLYKTQVKELAVYLGIPDKIINKDPTAGLWQGQTDEGEFGFTYEEADQILYLFTEGKMTEEEIVKAGFKEEVVKSVVKRYKTNNYKHLLPYIFPDKQLTVI